MSAVPTPDADARKGAIEQDARHHPTNTTLNGQLPHRNCSPLSDMFDTDFPEPGMNPEHTGQQSSPMGQSSRQQNARPQREVRSRTEREPGQREQDEAEQGQDSGQRRKPNRNREKGGPLAA